MTIKQTHSDGDDQPIIATWANSEPGVSCLVVGYWLALTWGFCLKVFKPLSPRKFPLFWRKLHPSGEPAAMLLSAMCAANQIITVNKYPIKGLCRQ